MTQYCAVNERLAEKQKSNIWNRAASMAQHPFWFIFILMASQRVEGPLSLSLQKSDPQEFKFKEREREREKKILKRYTRRSLQPKYF